MLTFSATKSSSIFRISAHNRSDSSWCLVKALLYTAAPIFSCIFCPSAISESRSASVLATCKFRYTVLRGSAYISPDCFNLAYSASSESRRAPSLLSTRSSYALARRFSGESEMTIKLSSPSALRFMLSPSAKK